MYSARKYSCVRWAHTLYFSYLIEHNGDDEPHDCKGVYFEMTVLRDVTPCSQIRTIVPKEPAISVFMIETLHCMTSHSIRV